MSFDSATVAKAAKLSRIAVSEEEKQAFVKEIGAIIGWIEQLNEVDDDTDVDAVASVSGETLPMRKDVVTAGNQPQDVLRNAPISEFNCFVVPKVIDQG